MAEIPKPPGLENRPPADGEPQSGVPSAVVDIGASDGDLLTQVTGFFRDPEVFQALKDMVLPGLMADRTPQSPVRVWVPGCSSGEEVYSLVIALLEHLPDKAGDPPIQMFATDISEAILDQARAGRYTENIAADVSPERLRRFFVKQDNHYQIAKSIRELCIFARQNVLRDPPLARLDLISGRNLLLYLDTPR
jgi:two-component system CheB/CheR fusion protein